MGNLTGQHILWIWARLSCNALELPGAGKIGEWAMSRTGEGALFKLGQHFDLQHSPVRPSELELSGEERSTLKKGAQSDREISNSRLGATLDNWLPRMDRAARTTLHRRAEKTPATVLPLLARSFTRLTMVMKMKMGTAPPSAVLRHRLANTAGQEPHQLLLEGASCSFQCTRPQQPPPLRECFAEARRTTWNSQDVVELIGFSL